MQQKLIQTIKSHDSGLKKKKKPNKIRAHLINICGMRFLNEFALALRHRLLAQLSLPLAVATTNDHSFILEGC